MEYGLIGSDLSHSLSPRLHALLGNYAYETCSIAGDQLDFFMRAKNFKGINLTFPYKQAAIKYCDELSPIARRCMSVNSIIKYDDGFLFGDNTDYAGFQYLIKKAGISMQRKRVLILGSGGAAAAVQAAAKDDGAASIIMVSRQGRVNYHNVYRHDDSQIIINATPVGMKKGDLPLLDLSRFTKCKAVIDLIYAPSYTPLLQKAAELGIPYNNGLPMLIAQAKYASDLFLGIERDDAIIDQILKQVLI